MKWCGCNDQSRFLMQAILALFFFDNSLLVLHGFCVVPRPDGYSAPPKRSSQSSWLQTPASQLGCTPSTADDSSTTLQAADVSTVLGVLAKIYTAGEEASSFLESMGVPTFRCSGGVLGDNEADGVEETIVSYRTVPGQFENHTPIFCLDNILTKSDCVDIIKACENSGAFRSFQAGKNHHDAMQLLVSQMLAEALAKRLAPFVSTKLVEARRRELESRSLENGPLNGTTTNVPNFTTTRLEYAGLNRRWRVYKYAPNAVETFAPHIDAGFPPSGLTNDECAMIYDASMAYARHDTIDIISRLTILFYLNDSFEGGETNFYAPRSTLVNGFDASSSTMPDCIASIQPVTGSCLIFPQCAGEEYLEYTRHFWPLHEGSPVQSGASKYVIRSDLLFYDVIR